LSSPSAFGVDARCGAGALAGLGRDLARQRQDGDEQRQVQDAEGDVGDAVDLLAHRLDVAGEDEHEDACGDADVAAGAQDPPPTS
jgi:hypothetical protein